MSKAFDAFVASDPKPYIPIAPTSSKLILASIAQSREDVLKLQAELLRISRDLDRALRSLEIHLKQLEGK